MNYELLYKVSFYIVAAVISMITLILVAIEGWIDRRQTKVFILMLIDVMISSIGSTMYKVLQPLAIGNDTVGNVMLLFQYLDFVAHTALSPLFYMYVRVLTDADHQLSKLKKRLRMIPFLLSFGLSVTNPLTGWVYYFDEQYGFHRNFGEVVSYVSAIFYFLLAVINLILFWRNLTRRRRNGILYCFLITAAGIGLQLSSQNLTVELMAEAVGFLLILLIVEREDDRIDQETRTYNRAAMHIDFGNYFRAHRPFHIVYVRILNYALLKKMVGTGDNNRLVRRFAFYFRSIHSKYQIYRVNESSFILACPDQTEGEVRALAETIREHISHSINYRDSELKLDAMILWASAPDQLQSLEDIVQLINSDVSELNRNMVVSGSDLAGFVRNINIEKALHRGVKEHDFDVCYQPIYQTYDKSVYGAEAVGRLNDRELSYIYSDEFMPVARKQNIHIQIERMLLEDVFVFLGSGIPTELGLQAIHVPLTMEHCQLPDFLQWIENNIIKYHIIPNHLVFMIQEPKEKVAYERLLDVTAGLKSMGFRLALENYGTGYSDMYAFSNLSLDMVTMEAEMLGGQEISEVGELILKHSMRMLKDMNLRILIRNAVEPEQITWFVEHEADYLQSEYFSKVVTQNELISILRVTENARRDEMKARAGSEAKSNFLANMSHEIRTPINAILGMNEMILRESKNDNVTAYAKDIESAGRSLLSLINDVLDFSKIEAGNMDIIEAEYDLSSLINDVVNMVTMRAQKKKLEFKLTVDENLPERLYGDEVRIRQIMINLLNNAVKYTQEGSVELSVHGNELPDQRLQLIIDVKDTGIGIHEEDKAKLFLTFQRLDLGKNRTVEGTGLGLTITQNLLRLMNGSIHVESEYGKGSVFTASLPQTVIDAHPIGDIYERTLALQKQRKVYKESFRAKDARILAVDDTPMNLTVFENLIKQTQIQIDKAFSGRECIEKAGQTRYDIIFLDYRMPEMDGVTTLKIMKSTTDFLNADTPIILFTANAVSGAKERFMREGFDDYLTKPVDGNTLERILLQYLPKDKVTVYQEKEEEHQEPEWVTKLRDAGLDVDKGIVNSGSSEGYEQIVRFYQEGAEQKAKEIEQYYTEQDYANYTIQVHSLKSTSRLIGAYEIGERAWEMEQAGDAGDVSLIREKTPELLAVFREFSALLGDILAVANDRTEEGEELPEISDDELREAWSSLSDFVSMMDYSDAEYVMEELKKYRLPEDQAEQFKLICTAIDALDWEEAARILRQGKEDEHGGV